MKIFTFDDDMAYKDPRDVGRDRKPAGKKRREHKVLEEGCTRSDFSYNFHRVQANKRGREF